MLGTHYTYLALASEWNGLLSGDSVAGIYTSRKNEASIELASGSVVVFGSRGPFRYLFRSEKSGRPRRNVTEVFRTVAGSRLVGVTVADRDRLLFFHLAGGRDLRFVMYGSKPNLLLVEEEKIVEAFKDSRRLCGDPAPQGRPAPRVEGRDEFRRMARAATSPARAVMKGFRLFDVNLAREAMHLAGLAASATIEEALRDGDRLYESALEVEERLRASEGGRIYTDGEKRTVFSLIDLESMAGVVPERFGSVDAAVNAATRRVLRDLRFDREIGPVRKAIGEQLGRSERRLREVKMHLDAPSRADALEKLGHLLMASGRGNESGLDTIEVADHFEDGRAVTIDLDSGLSVTANAERYYDRARRSRASRESARDRIAQAESQYLMLQRAASDLESVADMDELDSFRKEHGSLLSTGQGRDEAKKPFRRYRLPGEFEVWVGRNARENDLLTFSHARKFDIWLHARGVGGSHAVLRLPGRGVRPGGPVLEAAASIAAYHSKARGSELVPVTYTERKYVRKLRGGDPGQVVVEREEVVIVPPELPSA